MAVTGFWPIYKNLKATLDYADKTTAREYLDDDLYAAISYAENDNKTDRKMYVGGINCSKQNAYAEMIAVQRRFGLRGKVVGYHGIQSFKTGEVTPEQAFEIGMETARRMWCDKYQVLVTVHLNTNNVHCHFVVNPVSFKDGTKFQNKIGDHKELRKFTVKRVKTGSGKNKSAYSYLESIPGEKAMIQKLYEIFAATRSIKKTADKMNELGYRTKVGSKFNSSTTRLLLKNPVYCTADESAYNYFLEHNGGLCGDISDFDGQHGISAYNKTDQEKFEDADSTFISPKFVQLMSQKPLSEWIISVGRHEGFISSQKWIDTQNMLDDIAEKYNRPHRKTNALLAGLVYCPHCGKRLRVIPESNRWTNGKPRFKYVCPGYRVGECTFRAVDGVLLDEFVVNQLSHLADEDSRQSQMYAIRDIEEIKERLLSFGKYAENAAPDVLVTLIQTFVERIYITDENDERHCHIFIKGCSKEDYDDFFRATGYIENTQKTGDVTSVLPVCDSDECCKTYIAICIFLFTALAFFQKICYTPVQSIEQNIPRIQQCEFLLYDTATPTIKMIL